MPSKHLKAAQLEHIVSTTSGNSHAGYYPGAQPMTIQVTFSPNDGQLLGAQVAGFEGADKRLDILAAILNNGTLMILLNLSMLTPHHIRRLRTR